MFKLSTKIALILSIVALAGCGGGGDEPAPTKAAFIKEAEVICKKTDEKQLKALEQFAKTRPFDKMSSAEQLKVAIKVGFPPIEEEADELGSLTPPEGDEAKIEAIVEGIEEALEKGRKNPVLMKTEATTPFNKADELGTRYGFDECADTS